MIVIVLGKVFRDGKVFKVIKVAGKSPERCAPRGQGAHSPGQVPQERRPGSIRSRNRAPGGGKSRFEEVFTLRIWLLPL